MIKTKIKLCAYANSLVKVKYTLYVNSKHYLKKKGITK